MTPLEETKINNLLSEVGEEKLRLAINIAVMNQKKTFAYVDGIIKNWHAKGLNTIEEIKEDELHSKIVSSSNVQSKKALQELNDYNWLEDEEE